MIHILVVDDSALARTLIKDALDSQPDMQVVGVASDPFFARNKFKKLDPDVITLDLNMPRMDGLTFLERLMAFRPTPVVVVSGQTSLGAEDSVRALALGAYAVLHKPTGDETGGLRSITDEIVHKVRAAAGSNPNALRPRRPRPASRHDPAELLSMQPRPLPDRPPVVAIGASAGGTVALEQIISQLHADSPPLLICQHMPVTFTAAFAARMNAIGDLQVCEARDGMQLQTGLAIIARGDAHILLRSTRTGYVVRLGSQPPVNRHRPAVDVLFQSVATSAGSAALGILLTGMGTDGAQGLLQMRQQGAFTIAQDQSSSLVWGMPGAAVAMGAARKTLPLSDMPAVIQAWVRRT